MVETRDNIYIDNDCHHGDVMTYRVRACTKDGRASNWSAPATITVGNVTAPAAPVNFMVSASLAGCLLTWNFPVDSTNYAYTEVFRQTVKTGDPNFYNKVISGLTGTDFKLVDSKRAEEDFIPGDVGGRYCFKIRHVNWSGNKSAFSPVLCATPFGLKPQHIDAVPTATGQIYVKPPAGIPTVHLVYWPGGPDKPPVSFDNWSKEVSGKIDTHSHDLVTTTNKMGILDLSLQAATKAIGTNYIALKGILDTNTAALQKVQTDVISKIPELQKQVGDAIANDKTQ